MAESEASLLPAGTIFPRPGQVWEAIRDCNVHVHLILEWPGPRYGDVQLPTGESVVLYGQAPSGQSCPYVMTRLRAGERVRVVDGSDVGSVSGPKPLCALLLPLRYDELHADIVPLETRSAQGYHGYRLVVRTARAAVVPGESTYLNGDFTLIDGV